MRQVDKPDSQPTLGAPVNRPAPPPPVTRKVTDNVSEVSGRMFTEIARNIAAPPEQQPAQNPLKPGVP